MAPLWAMTYPVNRQPEDVYPLCRLVDCITADYYPGDTIVIAMSHPGNFCAGFQDIVRLCVSPGRRCSKAIGHLTFWVFFSFLFKISFFFNFFFFPGWLYSRSGSQRHTAWVHFFLLPRLGCRNVWDRKIRDCRFGPWTTHGHCPAGAFVRHASGSVWSSLRGRQRYTRLFISRDKLYSTLGGFFWSMFPCPVVLSCFFFSLPFVTFSHF